MDTVGNFTDTQLLQYENASCFVDSMCKFDEFHDGNPITFAVEQYLKTDLGKSGKQLNRDDRMEGDKFTVVGGLDYEHSCYWVL